MRRTIVGTLAWLSCVAVAGAQSDPSGSLATCTATPSGLRCP
jgi:hypothetical protein